MLQWRWCSRRGAVVTAVVPSRTASSGRCSAAGSGSGGCAEVGVSRAGHDKFLLQQLLRVRTVRTSRRGIDMSMTTSSRLMRVMSTESTATISSPTRSRPFRSTTFHVPRSTFQPVTPRACSSECHPVVWNHSAPPCCPVQYER